MVVRTLVATAIVALSGSAGAAVPAAFVLDPDDHNIEAVYHGPHARRAS